MIARLRGQIRVATRRVLWNTTGIVWRRVKYAMGCREILVLGDSHASVFKRPAFHRAFPEFLFTVWSVSGATASGIRRIKSKTQAYKIFRHAVQEARPTFVLTMLGEVDTGFLIWHRAQTHEAPVSKMFEDAVTKYTEFLAELASQHRVIVVSTPLPTIEDDNDWGEVAAARRVVKASQKDRTALTLRFNAHIRRFCETHDLHFVDLDPLSIGPDGLVRQELKHRRCWDHHYDPERYAALLIAELAKVLKPFAAGYYEVREAA